MQLLSDIIPNTLLNKLWEDQSLINELLKLTEINPQFIACRGEPTGTVIANTHGSALLPGVHLKLGQKVLLRRPVECYAIPLQRALAKPSLIKTKGRKVKKGKRK